MSAAVKIGTISSTVLRRRLKTVMNQLQRGSEAVVVTVGDCPRVVVADFKLFEELVYRAGQ